VTTRNDIIKHFKKLAEHSTFLHYAAESAERIGWALEVNLRDNRGRVILQLGSEPGVHWVSNLPGECVTGVAGSAPVPSGGYITEAAGRIDQAIRDWNALDSFGGVGPARAARRERAEAAAAVAADARAEFDARVAEVSREERGRDGDYQPGDVFRSAMMAKAAETLDRCMKNPLIAAAVAGNSDNVIAARMAGRAESSTDPVATASLSVEAMEPVRPAGVDDSAAFDYLGLYEKEGAYAWHWRQIMSRSVCPFATTWVEDKHTTWSSTPPSERNWTRVKQP
jgi:hypothetical protein